MKDYNEMSDFEINVLVVEKLGVDAKIEDGRLFTSKKHSGENVISVTAVTDYCNNPSDMWPLILEIGICITVNRFGEWTSSALDSGGKLKQWRDKNALRAAAIVYLIIKDEE